MDQQESSDTIAEMDQSLLTVLQRYLQAGDQLLEIGAKTAKEVVYFASRLPDIIWQTSTKQSLHSSIRSEIAKNRLNNILPLLQIDVNQKVWPVTDVDVVFVKNACHLMPWKSVRAMFRGVRQVLNPGGFFILCNVFTRHHRHFSEADRELDKQLRKRYRTLGIRDTSMIRALAHMNALTLIEEYKIPPNRYVFIWRK